MALIGTLKGFGIAEILQLISQQMKTGKLIITYPRYVISILFQAGIIKGFTDDRWTVDPRAKVLFDGGFIGEAEYKIAFNISRGGSQWGDILISQWKTDENLLDRATNVVVKDLFLELFYRKEGAYRFEDKEYDTEVMFTCNLSTENLILETLQIIDEWPLLTRKTPPMDYCPVVITPLTQEIIKKHDLTETDTKMLSLIDGKKTINTVIKESLESSFDALKSIVKLMDASLIDVFPQKKEKKGYSLVTLKYIKECAVYILLVIYIICLTVIGNPRVGHMFSHPLIKKYVREQKEFATQYSIHEIRPSDLNRDNHDR